MGSSKRSDTARTNGSKSHGPKTGEGKARSSQNAIRHGLRAKALVLPHESADAFRELLDGYLDEFDPQTPCEAHLVEEMAAARWRLDRAQSFETALFEKQLETEQEYHSFQEIEESQRPAYVFSQIKSKLHLLMRYEAALNRNFYRALKQLRELQKSRAAEPVVKETPASRKTPKAAWEPGAEPTIPDLHLIHDRRDSSTDS
jgi:hypothetical protein